VGPLRRAILRFYAQVCPFFLLHLFVPHTAALPLRSVDAVCNLLPLTYLLSVLPPPQASSHSYRLLSLKANGKFETIDSGDQAPLNVSHQQLARPAALSATMAASWSFPACLVCSALVCRPCPHCPVPPTALPILYSFRRAQLTTLGRWCGS
jgi:hypothetical protein